MQKKVLFIANTDRHIKLCHIPYLKMFKDSGYIVHVATNSSKDIELCDKKIKVKLRRNPFSFLNFFATFQIRKLVRKENYTVISCHTPIGGFLGRTAVIKNKVNTKVFYTAHGFHFYKGSSLFSWLIYYNIEKFLSRYTDLLLTMNSEDYKIASKKFKCDCVKINGIGVNNKKLLVDDNDLKEKLGLNNKYIVTYIAEMSKRKNQKKFVKELKKHDLDKESIEVLLIGDSTYPKIDQYVNKIKNVRYLGYKDDVGNYINISDLIVFPSKQEGMPLAVLEAMYFNKPIIAFDIRGCNELINNNVNGFLIPKYNMKQLVCKMIDYKTNQKLNITNNIEKYKIENVLEEVKEIYSKYIEL